MKALFKFYEHFQGEFLDIICFNKYDGWYVYTGQLDVIESEVIKAAEAWRKKHNKPVMITEYGADTAEGLHIVRTTTVNDSNFNYNPLLATYIFVDRRISNGANVTLL